VLYEGLLKLTPRNASTRDALGPGPASPGPDPRRLPRLRGREREFENALAELKRVTEAEPDNLEYQRHLAEGHHQLGVLLDARKQRAKAVEAYRAGLRIREPSWPLASRNNARSAATSPAATRYLGDTYLDMARRRTVVEGLRGGGKHPQEAG